MEDYVAVVFMDKNCGACKKQLSVLNKFYKQHKKSGNILTIDVKKHEPIKEITNKDGSYSTPTWVFFNKGKILKIHPGVIDKPILLKSVNSFGRSTRFGDYNSNLIDNNIIPQIDPLVTYGKNFPNGKGFQTNSSFMGGVQSVWGDEYLSAGTLGRDLGPGNFCKVFDNNYVNNIRMDRPGDDLDSALYLNRTSGQTSSTLQYPGMVLNSDSPQIVNGTSFGKKQKGPSKVKSSGKTRFGSDLYSFMGPAYKNIDVIDKIGGGTQSTSPRATKVNTDLYIGTGPTYNPGGILSFGKKKNKIREGTVLTIKKNKIKVKN